MVSCFYRFVKSIQINKDQRQVRGQVKSGLLVTYDCNVLFIGSVLIFIFLIMYNPDIKHNYKHSNRC